MIIDAINVTLNLNVSFPSVGFLADNSGEFANTKLDELTSKMRLTVRFGPAFSPWSNGINERNHVSADIMIKTMRWDKKMPLTDALVKAAAWTHNILMNKNGFSLLQPVTGKVLSLPHLTTGSEALESMTDSEVVQRTMKNLSRMLCSYE